MFLSIADLAESELNASRMVNERNNEIESQ